MTEGLGVGKPPVFDTVIPCCSHNILLDRSVLSIVRLILAYERGTDDGPGAGHTEESSGPTRDSVVALDVPHTPVAQPAVHHCQSMRYLLDNPAQMKDMPPYDSYSRHAQRMKRRFTNGSLTCRWPPQ